MFPFIPTGGSGSNYAIRRSLRFRSSASAYLSRTPSVAGNRKTWTYSAWVKRGALSPNISTMAFLDAGRPNNPWTLIGFSTDSNYSADNTITVATTAGVSPGVYTTASYRDPAAWYHIVVAMDTTQATAANRIKVYVNGVQQSINSFNIPAQNYDTYVNSTTSHSIGSLSNGGSEYFDGYLAEVNLVDGQALTPSSFGTFNATTGVWQPARYTGSYGTNGFYLPFTNNASTTTLGYDFSPNGNNWTTNNISLTAGSTYDSMTDVPTLTSATAGNYARFSSISNPYGFSITGAGLIINQSGGQTSQGIKAPFGMSAGKWYWEVTTISANVNNGIGIAMSTTPESQLLRGGPYNAATAGSYGLWGNTIFENGYSTKTATGSGTVIGIALDCDNSTVQFYGDGVSKYAALPITSGATWHPFYSADTRENGPGGVNDTSGFQYSGSSSLAYNFGQRPFTYTPPSGFVALNTYNLPAPTISNGAAHMAATLWTGDGANPRTITNTVNGVSLQPDLVWVKARSNAYDHTLYDSIRGATNYLISNSTAAEGSAANTLQAFNSNGFQVGGSNSTNSGSVTYVGWQWKANGAAVTNTAGSITSQVSANTAAGFSVVTYTGTGANATVGHGLGVAPVMILNKSRSSAFNWHVFFGTLGNGDFEGLNTTSAYNAGSSWFNGTASTSSVFSAGASQGTSTYVSYCFAAVPGYSAFGSYTGNGSTDGPFVYLGFRPRYILTKATQQSSQWFVWDSARSPFNASNDCLFPESSQAETADNSALDVDFLSNGFKIRNTGSGQNNNTYPYIYAAFAENPFKTSLAR